ncbi:hypothetical protein [Streptomyces sp. NPDC002785]|uniref:hypothetical protein n=1 Tax=Streptomyces sp. NPDC002785 TaxID=3154543 RepID=UPI00332A2710
MAAHPDMTVTAVVDPDPAARAAVADEMARGADGPAPRVRVAGHHEVVSRYGLPTKLPHGVDTGELVDLMRLDKKATTGLTFVLDGPDGAELVSGVPQSAIATVLAEMPRQAPQA